MSVYDTWDEEKKEKFREISVDVIGALSSSIKNAMLRQTITNEETTRWNAVNKRHEKIWFYNR